MKSFLLIGVALFMPFIAVSQDRVRLIEESDPKLNFPNAPVAIVSRSVGNKTFLSDGKFVAGPDWLKNLTLDVQNVSTKRIIRFEINLKIEKQGSMTYDAGMEYYFRLRNEPVLDKMGRPTGEYKIRKPLEPGEIVTVKLAEHQLPVLDDIKRFGITDIERVFMSIRRVVFDNGTGWFVGIETREDPNFPGSQIPVGTGKFIFSSNIGRRITNREIQK